MKRPDYYLQTIADLNDSRQLPAKIKIGNNEKQLTKEQIEKHFHSIENYTRKMDNKQDYTNLLCRAMDFELIQDYQSAIEDYTKYRDKTRFMDRLFQ